MTVHLPRNWDIPGDDYLVGNILWSLWARRKIFSATLCRLSSFDDPFLLIPQSTCRFSMWKHIDLCIKKCPWSLRKKKKLRVTLWYWYGTDLGIYSRSPGPGVLGRADIPIESWQPLQLPHTVLALMESGAVPGLSVLFYTRSSDVFWSSMTGPLLHLFLSKWNERCLVCSICGGIALIKGSPQAPNF